MGPRILVLALLGWAPLLLLSLTEGAAWGGSVKLPSSTISIRTYACGRGAIILLVIVCVLLWDDRYGTTAPFCSSRMSRLKK
jgi:hypothetical protein